MIRVGVLGAAGRMGRMICRAVLDDPELELIAGVIRPGAAVSPGTDGLRLIAGIDAMASDDVDVAVDVTRPDSVMANVRWLLDHAIHAVVGTSGLRAEDLDEIAACSARSGANAIVVPNFAIGAVLMQRFAELAAPHMAAAEIVELHHDGKRDAPSGTAVATARRIAVARSDDAPRNGTVPVEGDGSARGQDIAGVRVHSVRLPGLVAHQEVIFGDVGQTLTIRHDSTDRASFMPGVVLAIKAVGSRRGLTVGLEPLLGLSPEG